jgi:glutamate---cysteine ligase / carboxylate-amine ligase
VIVTGQTRRQVGVEEEFLLIDSTRLRAMPDGEAVVAEAARRLPEPSGNGHGVAQEFKREQVEIGSAPRTDLAEVESDLRDLRAALSGSARTLGRELAAMGTCPLPVTSTTSPDERYRQMIDDFGIVARNQLTCGMHVHVSITTRAEGVAVLDRIRPWLPTLLALSANSPFWQGEDTSYASYRHVELGLWPSSGPTEEFGDEAGYDAAVANLINSGAALDAGMIYFDARLSARYPTVEIRAADVASRLSTAMMVAALCRALAETAARDALHGCRPSGVRRDLLRAAMWRAARSGMSGDLVDPVEAKLAGAWNQVDKLVDHVAVALQMSDDAGVVDGALRDIQNRGTGSDEQRISYAWQGDMRDVVLDAIARTTE